MNIKFKSLRMLADIASRGGRVPPLYVYVVFVLPGFAFSIMASHRVNYVPFLVSAIAIVPLMAAVNLFDDFFDFRYGCDKPGSPNTFYRRHPIFSYGVSPRYLLEWAISFSLIYFLLLSADAFFYGRSIIFIGVAGFILGYGYTGPPFKYKYYGLGEIGVFISVLLANLLVSSSCLRTFDAETIVYTVPFSLLIVLMFLAGNTRDIESDRNTGFLTMPVILGRRRSVILMRLVTLSFYVSTLILVLIGFYSPLSLFVSAGMPLGFISLNLSLKNDRVAELSLGPFVFLSLIALAVLSILR